MERARRLKAVSPRYQNSLPRSVVGVTVKHSLCHISIPACPHPVFHRIQTELAVSVFTPHSQPTSRPLSTGKSFGSVCVFYIYLYVYVLDQITEANIGLNQVPSGFLRSHGDIFWVINSRIMNLEPVAWCLCQCPAGGGAQFLFTNTSLTGRKLQGWFFFYIFWPDELSKVNIENAERTDDHWLPVTSNKYKCAYFLWLCPECS